MKRIYTYLLSLLILFTLQSQQVDLSKFENKKPRSIGPAGMSGRITAIDVVNSKPDVIYAGAASGGVWKSESGGIEWQPIFDDQSTQSIGAIAIQQSNPSVVWVGTGEGNPRNSLNGGNGIYKSLDGGKNWKCMGLEKTRHIHRIIIHPSDPSVIYVGAVGSPWGGHSERGVFKTVDGGKSWDQVLFTNDRTGVADLVMDPENPNKLIAAMWEHDRKPWFFKSGGIGSGLYMTHDGGVNWIQITEKEGIPKGELGRIGLAIAPSSPNKIYALIESDKNALYASGDGGVNWVKVNDKDEIGNRPFYYSDIFVDPKNENRLYSIFSYVHVSEDAGRSFTPLMPAYNTDKGVHPDHHAWWVHPENPKYMIDGNDGGLYITRDAGKTWYFAENLPVGQFYHIAVDNDIPFNIYGGMQDNGTWVGPSNVWKAQGIRNDYWQEISFGDGFDVLPDPTNNRYGISTSQQGWAGIYDRVTGNFESIKPTNPGSDIELRFNWNAAMARSPIDPKTIYMGSQFVHKSKDGGQSWVVISPDLTTNDTTKLKQRDSGGLTIDATGAENFCTIITISPSPSEEGVIWAGTDDGLVHVTKDDGKNWKNVSTGLPNGSWITQIRASQNKKGKALLVANDYRRFNYEPMAFQTLDYGQTWTRIVDKNDALSYALCIVEHPEEGKLKFLGTDDGLYVSFDDAASWQKWTHGIPSTNVMDLIVHPRDNDLAIGTFGRSFYILDDLTPLVEIAKTNGKVLDKKLAVFPVPVTYLQTNQQPSGTRFGANSKYNGSKKGSGALITYWINEPDDGDIPKKPNPKQPKGSSKKVENEKKEPADTIYAYIYKDSGLIRTIKKVKPEKDGLHTMRWGLREKGIHSLKRKKEERKNEPIGVTVVPGKYKVILKFNDFQDSTFVEIRKDPRLSITYDEMLSRYSTLKDLEKIKKSAFDALEYVKESIEIVKTMKDRLVAQKDSTLSPSIKYCDSIKASLNIFVDEFVGKEDKRQGIVRNRPVSINAKLSKAFRYVSNGQHAPGETEKKLIESVTKSLAPLLMSIDDFYKDPWEVYKKDMEAINPSPFARQGKL